MSSAKQVVTPEEAGIQGMILYEGVTGSKGIRKLVDRRIRDWIGRKKDATFSHLKYLVRFTRESGTNQVACEVEIDSGQEVWRGQFYARGTQYSFMQALRNVMNPKLPTPPGGASLAVLTPAFAAAGGCPP